MEKEEILNYLAEKNILTKPVDNARHYLDSMQERYDNAMDRFKYPIYFFGGLCIVPICNTFFFNNGTLFDNFMFLVIMLFFVAVFYGLRVLFAKPSKAAYEEAYSIFVRESNRPEYIAGKEGFPAKFYNYNDTYKLYFLIKEGRAFTLPEAYNLLEVQKFHNSHLQIQEQIRDYHQDIANSARVTAASSVATAYNTHNINKQLGDVNKQLGDVNKQLKNNYYN